jgi:arginine/lysine/ornithine decarboxylase
MRAYWEREHKPSFAGLVLSSARPVYVDSAYDEELELAHTVPPEALAHVLDSTPRRLVLRSVAPP